MKITHYQTPKRHLPYMFLALFALLLLHSGPALAQGPVDSVYTCRGSCTQIQAPVTGVRYLWNTGDTTDTITYCASANVLLHVKTWYGPGGTDTGTFYVYVNTSVCVWPGDANNDGIVDINDMLNVGIAYGETGPSRFQPSTSWTAQACGDWTNSFASGTNQKFADCTGDGVIDSSDFGPISLNFSKSHSKTSAAASGASTDPPLIVRFSHDSVQAGDTITAIISLGSGAINANNIYGITLGINYGGFQLVPKKIVPDFGKSWLGTIHKDLFSLSVNDTLNKTIYIGLTRVDHNNVSGSGEIGALSIYMPDDIAGKKEVKEWFNLKIISYKSIDSKENTVALDPVSDSATVYEYKAGIPEVNLALNPLEIFPNPATSSIHVQSANVLIKNIVITDIVGRVVYASTFGAVQELNVPISNLSAGIYTLHAITSKGTFQTKFIKK